MTLSISPIAMSPAFGTRTTKPNTAEFATRTYSDGRTISSVDANTLGFLKAIGLFQEAAHKPQSPFLLQFSQRFSQWVEQKKYTPQNLADIRAAIGTDLTSPSAYIKDDYFREQGRVRRNQTILQFYGLNSEAPTAIPNFTEISRQLGVSSSIGRSHYIDAMKILCKSVTNDLNTSNLRQALKDAGLL